MIKAIYEGVNLNVYEVENRVVQLKKDDLPTGLVEKKVGDNVLVTHKYLNKNYGIPISNCKVVSSQSSELYVRTECLVLTNKDEPITINELGYLVRPTKTNTLNGIACQKDKLYMLDDPNIKIIEIKNTYSKNSYWIYANPIPSYFLLKETKQDSSLLAVMADHCDRYNIVHYNINNNYYKLDISNEEKIIKAIGCRLELTSKPSSNNNWIKLSEIERIDAADSGAVLLHDTLNIIVPTNINKLTLKNGLYRGNDNIVFINEDLDITKHGYTEISKIKNKIIRRNLSYARVYCVKQKQIVPVEGTFVKTEDIQYRLVKSKEEREKIKELSDKYKSILPPNVKNWRLDAVEKYIEARLSGYLDKPTINILGYVHEIIEEEYMLLEQFKPRQKLRIQTSREKDIVLYKSIDLCSIEVPNNYQTYGIIKAFLKLWSKENKYHLIKMYIDKINMLEFEKLNLLIELERLIANQ